MYTFVHKVYIAGVHKTTLVYVTNITKFIFIKLIVLYELFVIYIYIYIYGFEISTKIYKI